MAALESVHAQDTAAAQDTTGASASNAKSLDAVNVLGSRIRSVDVENAQPVFTITSLDIQKSGLLTAGDIINNLVSAAPATYGRASTLASNIEQGGQYLNYRHLGENRVVVLVNGKRWATSPEGYSDISTIPSSLIERVDVLGVGNSALYGSDAISGVVNFVLKSRFDGAEASATMGQNQGGDGLQQEYSFTLGTTGKKASILFGANITRQAEVWANSRDWTRYTYGQRFFDGALGGGPWGRYSPIDANGQPTGDYRVLNHTGSFNGVGVGADSRDPANYHDYEGANEDLFNSTQQMMLRTPSDLKSFFTSGSYDFTDKLRFTTNVGFSERTSKDQNAGYPFTSLSQPTYPVYLSADSYYNPLPGQDLYVQRRTIELPRITTSDVKSYHFDGGFNGLFDVGSRTWNWDAGFNYNRYDGTQESVGNLNLINLKSALGPSFLNEDGVVQCGTAATPIPLGTGAGQCVPFNILGGPSASTAQALSYINDHETARFRNDDKEYTFNLNGGLFDLPAGEVSLAVGYEHRDVSGFIHPDALAQAGYSTDLAGNPTDGRYHTNEFYAELNVPVLKDLPGAQLLTFDIASRYSKYSNFGSTTKNSFTFQWKPIDDLMVRGDFVQGFRAPTIGDFAGGGSQTFDSYIDPCDRFFGSSASNSTVAANCNAAGVPANFHQQNQAGNAVHSAAGGQSPYPFNAGVGNTGLQPETSVTRDLGLVYSPSWAEGLNVTLDYYNIRVNNLITATGTQYVLDQCYQFGVQAYCDNITRNSTGQVQTLSYGNINAGWIKTSGYEFNVTYRLPRFDFGQFVISFQSNILSNYDQRDNAGTGPINHYAGNWGYARKRANLGIDWSLGDWGATWGVRYYGTFRDDCWDPDAGIHCNRPDYTSSTWGTVGADRIGAVIMHDVSASWQAPWNGTFRAGIRNLFNKRPPLTLDVDNSSAAAYDPALDLTRYFFVSYDQKF